MTRLPFLHGPPHGHGATLITQYKRAVHHCAVSVGEGRARPAWQNIALSKTSGPPRASHLCGSAPTLEKMSLYHGPECRN